ncbi:hypothetical protein [Paenibacillus glucanolyticus]|uniref:hypothetical protein n=1 Tax=Paenibacillus glucanolyticus TaxID=59843 RepID=UPI00128B04DA|nr:hypothetical protein [Paenibacillus glucanolyticus]MPY20046.1 hypothetical protein [Paenibacillus glucanolyticus]
MKTMYPAQVNSPGTELAAAIDAVQDTIQVADGSVLPEGPNLLTIGTDEAAETILYTGKNGDELTGVTRRFQGIAQSWAAGTKVARYFTAYDHDAAVNNISELSMGLKALGDAARDRLDIELRQDIVLNAGLQILNAQRRAAFSLGGIKGQTLVNLAGRQTSRTVNSTATTTISVGLGTTGDNTDSINVDIKNTGEAYITYNQAGGNVGFTAVVGKYYLVLADIKINSISGAGQIKLGVTFEGAYTADKAKIGVWQRVSHRFTAASDRAFSIIAGTCYAGGVFATANFDIKNVSFYEITKADYDSLHSLSENQLATKYPYVDSVTPVRNPYAIRYGENLLPPFYEWSQINNKGKILSPYSYLQPEYNDGAWSNVSIPVKPFKDYAISFENIGGARIRIIDNKTPFSVLLDLTDTGGTFNSGDNTTVSVYIDAGIVGQVNNPMLTLGSSPKPFKPREDTMLALQTDLYSDPVTGADTDEVFEKDGQYFKLAKWKGMTLDGGKGWEFATNYVGRKRVRLPNVPMPISSYAGYCTKYNGKLLVKPDSSWGVAGDQWGIDTNAVHLLITIENTDSGWGDNYTPTPDEIKAYFMGWTMYNGSAGGSATPDNPANNVYNGTGTKAWAYRADGVTRSWLGWSGTLPTTVAPNWTPYQLVYQLATPTVEPIVSEGMLTFNEGDNQIEVGTGIVVRESVNPRSLNNLRWYINTNYPGLEQSALKYRPSDILGVYKNGRADEGEWVINSVDAFGGKARLLTDSYDPSAAYSVTYLMLDKSPIVPFIGSYATNEKAMLQELTDAVQQNATAVSVLMNKKADKDAPTVWITPTLLNGWVNMGSGTSAVAYTKDASGFVHLKGRIKSGTMGWNPVFILPVGYRPKEVQSFLVRGYTTQAVMCSLVISTDGTVMVADGTNTEVAIDGVTLLAEQ